MYLFVPLKNASPLIIIALLIVCLEFSPKTQWASSPVDIDSAGVNTAERQKTPLNPAGGGWQVTSSPNTGSPHNYFYGVAAIASNDVWAVGGYGNLTTRAQQLIQQIVQQQAR